MATVAKFEYYRDRAGRWRWHLKAPNGLVIADSGQGYRSEQDCVDGVQLVKRYAPGAEVARGLGGLVSEGRVLSHHRGSTRSSPLASRRPFL